MSEGGRKGGREVCGWEKKKLIVGVSVREDRICVRTAFRKCG